MFVYLRKEKNNAKSDNGGRMRKHLRKRIEDTCRAHLDWVKGARRADGCFRTDYWATGKEILPNATGQPSAEAAQGVKKIESTGGPQGSREALRVDDAPDLTALSDTPFQILKFGAFAAVFDKDRDTLREDLRPIVRGWVRHLDKDNKQGFFVFSRAKGIPRESYLNYRLEDHVCIWDALQVVVKLDLSDELKKGPENKKNKMDQRNPEEEESEEDESEQDESEEDESEEEESEEDESEEEEPEEEEPEEESEEGTPENDESGEEEWKEGRPEEEPEKEEEAPLSQDYSPTEFQKIVLRRFTAKIPESKKSLIAVARSWSQFRFLLRTRDTALFHDTGEAFFKPSSALWNATVVAQKYHMENQDSAWDSPLRYGLALLMATAGHQINSRSPTDMLRRAKLILFQSSSADGILAGMLNAGTSDPEIFQDESRRDFYWHTSFETLYIIWKVREKLTSGVISDVGLTNESLEIEPRLEAEAFLDRIHLMKKSISVNNHIIEHDIVELSDEWLYKFPDFLDFKPKSKDKREYNSDELEELKGIIIDVPKTKRMADGEKRYTSRDYLSDDNDNVIVLSGVAFKHKLDQRRTAKDAKKRLIWTPQADSKVLREVFVDASPPETEDDPASLAKFLMRHSRKEKYLGDDITASLNVWKTDFHLSSYQLSKENGPRKGLSFFGDKRIRLAGMGFRFVGDIFDRYWTCHVLGFEPDDDIRRENPKKRFAQLIQNRIPEHERWINPWRQRKVLELILFDRMLEKIIDKYRTMLKEVMCFLKDRLPHTKNDAAASSSPDDSSFSEAISLPEMKSYEYLKFRDQWPSLQFALQTMEKDLKETLDTIALWKTRQQDRHHQILSHASKL
ncbi:hypothetical protein A1O1_06002 [Capronia coronata CBS 617.96]|uniref:Uncharacterized protein n=1 Tax=Capronia coronata CBS 617.96 TaxID=1182541 RepID=W9Y8R4_9EURO|nr:uncharacterized protein A1O1_06002 [Capronia coronata CBS 617.96]EXJ85636.1 hypothetical protein A1O1_06002 [Capronia coronata CBS 617.96]